MQVLEYDDRLSIVGFKAGEALAEGELIYLAAATSLWMKAVNTAVATQATAVAGRTVTAAQVLAGDETAEVTGHLDCLVEGYAGLTIGGRVYADPATAGGVTDVQPVAVGDVLQCVGVGLTATKARISVHPSVTVVQAAAVATINAG